MKVPNNSREKSSQKFTWVRLFLAKGKELPSAIIGAASAKDACIIIFLLFE